MKTAGCAADLPASASRWRGVHQAASPAAWRNLRGDALGGYAVLLEHLVDVRLLAPVPST
jgi:hypothetical protein